MEEIIIDNDNNDDNNDETNKVLKSTINTVISIDDINLDDYLGPSKIDQIRKKRKTKRISKIVLLACAIIMIIICVIVGILSLYCLSNPIEQTCMCRVWRTSHCKRYAQSTQLLQTLIPIHSTTIIPHTNMFCKIHRQKNNIRSYPSTNKYVYGIEFNASISQANYVYYISPVNGKRVNRGFRKDPYDINPLRTEDYTNLPYKNPAYNRGHLVPNADYGYDTFIISNVVPMVTTFNNGVWKKSEWHIRKTYPNKLIYKGCDYSEYYVMSSRNNKLYIPTGCYYIVFDTSRLPGISDLTKSTNKIVLEYGYYKNKKNSVRECKIPNWAECHGIFDHTTCH